MTRNPHFEHVIQAARILVLKYHRSMCQPIHILGQLDSRMHFLSFQSTAALSVYTPPWLNDMTRFWSYTDTGLVEIVSQAVFGLSKPPDQYKFVFFPRNTKVLPLASVDPTPTPSSNVPDTLPLLHYLYRIFASPASITKLSSSFNPFKAMSALLQSL